MISDPYVLRIVGVVGEHGAHVIGMLIEDFDFDESPGGYLKVTLDPRKAHQCEGIAGVMAWWQTVSTKWPTRPTDGKPNRPMTYFSIEPIPLTIFAQPPSTSVN